jgi:hypothetical protein
MRQTSRMPLIQDMRERRQRAWMLTRLRALLHNLRRHPHRTRRHFSQTRGQHVHYRLTPTAPDLLCVRFAFGIVLYLRFRLRKRPFYRVVSYEEEGCAGGGPDNCAADAPVYAIEASTSGETRAGLETRF